VRNLATTSAHDSHLQNPIGPFFAKVQCLVPTLLSVNTIVSMVFLLFANSHRAAQTRTLWHPLYLLLGRLAPRQQRSRAFGRLARKWLQIVCICTKRAWALDVRETNRPAITAFSEPPNVHVVHTHTLLRTARHSSNRTCRHQLAYDRKQGRAARPKTASQGTWRAARACRVAASVYGCILGPTMARELVYSSPLSTAAHPLLPCPGAHGRLSHKRV
jgi:hypothetical protein